MCTCSREVTERGYVWGSETITGVSLPDSDMFAACQALCCRTKDCAAGGILFQEDTCFLLKNAEGDNVRIESTVDENFAFLC